MCILFLKCLLRNCTLCLNIITLELYFQNLQDDIQDHSKNLEYINKTGEDLQKKSSPGDKAKKLQGELSDMNERWSQMSEEVDNRIYKLEAAIEQLTQLEVNMSFVVVERLLRDS